MGRPAEMVLGVLRGKFGIFGGLFAVFIGGSSAVFETTGALEIIGQL